MTPRLHPARNPRFAAACVLAMSACATAPPAPPALRLAATIDSIIAAPPLHRTHWGIAVRDAETGVMLYDHNAEKHFIPASNMKLVVTIVALGVLGPDYRYRTDVLADSPPGDSSAAALIVRARGDPTLSARFDSTDFAPLDSLARQVAASGIRRVWGDLIIDASWFDDEHVNGTWEVGDLPLGYATPVGAFAIGEGAFRLVRAPGPRVGAPAYVSVIGGDALQPLALDVTTDTADAPLRWSFDVTDRRDTVRISGRVPIDRDADTLRYAVTDPNAYAGRAFHAALERAGVQVTGRVRIVDDSTEFAREVGDVALRTVASRASPPLTGIVAAILKPSQNWMAEQLLKTLGAVVRGRGSWSSGIAVEERYLVDSIRIDSLAFNFRDASGLSAQNLLAPEAIVQLLTHARNAPWGAAYRDALPAPGERGGTLSSRLRGLEDRVAAKTGSISNVNSLSGYIDMPRGRTFVFSIQSNASGVSSSAIRNAIDAIVRAIAREGGSP